MNDQYIPQALCVTREEFDRCCASISSPSMDNNLKNYATELDAKLSTNTTTTKIRKQPLNLNQNSAKQWRKERRAFYRRLKELKRISSKLF